MTVNTLLKKKVDIIIFIEHKDREMQISKYLKKKLEENNYSVIIASLHFHAHIILFQYEIKTIVTPYIGFGKSSISNLFFKVHGLNINYINMNYEQFLFPFAGKFKIPKTEPAKKYQINFAWGDHFKEYLTDSGASKKNIYITGRPYAKIIKELNLNKNKIKIDLANDYNLNPNKKWVFIALTDPLSFLDDKTLDKIVEAGADKKGMYFQVDHDRDSIVKLCKILSDLDKIKNISEFEFILRPHPSISSDSYIELFQKNNLKIPKSLKIIKGDTAPNWLVSSDVLITNYSTLIIDAYNCNKKILTFNHDFKKFNYLWWVKYSNNIFYNLSELETFLNKDYKKLNEKLSNYYIANINSINESSKVISHYTNSTFKHSNPSFLKLINEFILLKSIIGSMVRNFIIKNLKNPFNIIKEGLEMDYFDFKKINK